MLIVCSIILIHSVQSSSIPRGAGFTQTAGNFLCAFDVEVVQPHGFGSRHMASAEVTKRAAATSIVVSAADGNVRVLSGGTMVLHMDPNAPYDLVVGDKLPCSAKSMDIS